MRCRGCTLLAISKKLGLTIEGTRRALLRVEEREAYRLARSVHRVKARQNGQLDEVIHQGFSSWYKSKQPRHRALRTEVGEGPGRDVSEKTEALSQCGDVRYLMLVLSAQASQRELTGLNISAADNPIWPADLVQVITAWKQGRPEEAPDLPARPEEP
jgi:hypothetical protein